MWLCVGCWLVLFACVCLLELACVHGWANERMVAFAFVCVCGCLASACGLCLLVCSFFCLFLVVFACVHQWTNDKCLCVCAWVLGLCWPLVFACVCLPSRPYGRLYSVCFCVCVCGWLACVSCSCLRVFACVHSWTNEGGRKGGGRDGSRKKGVAAWDHVPVVGSFGIACFCLLLLACVWSVDRWMNET